MDDANAASRAGRWFAVRAEYEQTGRVRTAWLVAKDFLLYFLTFSLAGTVGDPRRSCDVVVYRRDNRQVVAVFSYNSLADATEHVSHLQRRLAESQVFDFCRDLGLRIEEASGPGEDDVEPEGEVWRPIARRKASYLW